MGKVILVIQYHVFFQHINFIHYFSPTFVQEIRVPHAYLGFTSI